MNGRKVFGVAAKVERTVLSVVPSIEDAAIVVQLIGDGGSVNFHAGGKDDEIVPLAHYVEEVVEMRALVHEKPHGMFVDDNFEHEIGRRSGLDRLSYHSVVMRVNQRLVEIQHEHFPLHHGQSLPRDRRESHVIVTDGLMLDQGSDLALEQVAQEAPHFGRYQEEVSQAHYEVREEHTLRDDSGRRGAKSRAAWSTFFTSSTVKDACGVWRLSAASVSFLAEFLRLRI